MRNINYSVLRSVFALVLGIIMLVWPNTALNYLIITIGILFLIPGGISIIGYFVQNRKEESAFPFPLEGLGSFLFGLFLVIIPGFFADFLTILLGIVLILGGVQQLGSLVKARRWTTVPFVFYIVPVLILLAGIMVIFNPEGTRATALMIIGVTALFYGLFELINWFKFTRHNPARTEISFQDEDNLIDN